MPFFSMDDENSASSPCEEWHARYDLSMSRQPRSGVASGMTGGETTGEALGVAWLSLETGEKKLVSSNWFLDIPKP